MAIHITELKQISEEYSIKDYIYKDLHLDLTIDGNYSHVLEKKIETNDIKVSLDELAIRNSLRNLFNTKRGQRFLFPEYGLDFYEFLFEPCTDYNGQTLGERISRAIQEYEPRVKLIKVNVIADPETHTYDIDVIVQMPTLNTRATINTQLDLKKQSFIFVESSRNR